MKRVWHAFLEHRVSVSLTLGMSVGAVAAW